MKSPHNPKLEGQITYYSELATLAQKKTTTSANDQKKAAANAKKMETARVAMNSASRNLVGAQAKFAKMNDVLKSAQAAYDKVVANIANAGKTPE